MSKKIKMERTIKYKINKDDNFGSVRPFFEAYPEAVEQLLQQVSNRAQDVNFESLSVKSLLELLSGKLPTELDGRLNGGTVEQFGEVLHSLRDGVATFEAFMKRTTPPKTPESVKMAKGQEPQGLEEAVLWTLRTAFSLHGFEDAHRLTIYEYMVARKNIYNEAIVAYNQSMAAGAGAAAARRR